ncbi:MAG: extracellular solute-binding protein [Actinomycetota bacterium]
MKKLMQGRLVPLLMLFLAFALVASACGGSDEPADTTTTVADAGGGGDDGGDDGTTTTAAPADPVDPVTLTVWSWRTEDEDAYNEIFDVYEAANPGVTVEFVPFVNTDYNTILSTGLTGDGGPDVAQLRAYGGIQPLIEAGQLLPIDGELDLSNFTDNVLKAATGQSDGRVYGVPFAYQAFTAFYNVGIFDELGLSEPTTWDEWISTLDALDAAGYIPISAPAADNWMLAIIHDAIGAPRYGGQDFEAAILAGEKDFTDPDYVASIGLMQDLQQYLPDDVVGVSYEDSKTLFLTEQAGIFIGGSFEIGFWRDNGPDLDLGVFAVPAPPDSLAESSVVGWMDGSYGVNASSDSVDDAKKLVEWMGTVEFGQLFTTKIKQLSPIPGTTPDDPLLAEFGELFAASPVSYLSLVNFRYGDPSADSLFREGVVKMWLGDSTPEEIAADVQAGVFQWFTPGG